MDVPVATTARRERVRSAPLLTIDDIDEDKKKGQYVASLKGCGSLASVDMKLGKRQLFFFVLLFKSTREERIGGELCTVVDEADASRTLKEWARCRFLGLGGLDRKRPADRVQKLWHGMMGQMKKISKLKDLFLTVPAGGSQRPRLYGIKVQRNRLQNHILDLKQALRRPRT